MFPSGSNNVNNANNSLNTSNSNNSINKMSPSSSGITTPTRISIKEANDHLQLLHSKVFELEERIRQQTDQANKQADLYMKQLKDLKAGKEAQIEELTKTIVRLEERVKDLESELKIKNEKLEEGQNRLTLLDQFVAKYIPNIQEMVIFMKRLSTGAGDEILPNRETNPTSAIGLMPDINGSYPSMVDISAQTDVSGATGLPCKMDSLNNGSSVSEPCYSKRSSFDDSSKADKISPEERSLPISGDGLDNQWMSEKQMKTSRDNRQRKVRKSLSAINCQYLASPNAGKDIYGENSYSNVMGIGRSIGPKMHPISSSFHNISGKVEKSFSITSNFSEDEDIPTTNGSRTYHR